MRKRWLTTIVLFGVLGGVAGGTVGVVAHSVATPGVRTSFGWYSYSSMPRRYADYLPVERRTDWFALLGTSIGIGLAVGVALAAVVLMTGRSVVLQRVRGQ